MKAIKQFYEEKYKILLIIPFILLFAAFVQIGLQTAATGDFVNKGVSLSGGSTITITDTTTSLETIESTLQQEFPNAELSARTLGKTGIIIESTIQDETNLQLLTDSITELAGVTEDQLTTEVMGSSLGESFFKQTMIALLVAFLLMGVVVFLYFRTLAPSLAVILAAGSDIIITVAIFNLTGQKLQTAGIAALLMLIGYSVDTDILVTTHLLKRRGQKQLMKRVYEAMKTGLTMVATTIIVLIITLILVKSEIVKQIALILVIGLLVDLIMTWIQNVGILRLYLESVGEKHERQKEQVQAKEHSKQHKHHSKQKESKAPKTTAELHQEIMKDADKKELHTQ